MYNRWISGLIKTADGLEIWSPRAMRRAKIDKLNVKFGQRVVLGFRKNA